MKTPWGEIAVTDAHVHFFSRGFFEILARQKGSPVEAELTSLGFDAPDTDATLAGRWVQELNQNGVQSTVLIASAPGDEESVLTSVRSFPERFHGFFILDPTQPDALARATQALSGGMQGICFFPAMHRYSIQDERVKAILETISGRSGIAVFVHCGVLSVGIRGKLGLPSHFDMRYSNPVDVHAVASRFPRTSFVIPHFGAGYFREALMLADLCPNVYFDTSSSNNWVKYQVPMMDVRDAFRRSIDLLGAHRLLFGTDSSYFPRGWRRSLFEAQANLLFDRGVGLDDAALILGGNIRRILAVG